jgi:hypothetical protein
MSNENETKIARVLSIDAWAQGPEEERGWQWNQWHKVGTVDLSTLPESDADLLAWFVSEGFVNEKALIECEIEDDQYNYVLTVKDTGEPLYAIEYGALD